MEFLVGFQNSFTSEVLGFSGGIWLLWNDNITIDIVKVHPPVVHMRITQGSSAFISSAVYASLQKMRELWKAFDDFAYYVCEPWILAGHFNSILGGSERQWGQVKGA
ncbi:hypothetical protein J1N35_004258 [Gossypium stocksii]|uniref:Endonuclease/exonuclease/phosphatase domain-containing protein n=1 Tax=Gossypium stocksii TaxID=47602 RepID=A0A9D4AHU9_9ROSI|nr:hypothetical protein J1N35_004258 [Gossypium stocksii]